MKGNMLGRVGGSKTGLLASSIGSPTGYDGTRSAKDSPARSLSDPLEIYAFVSAGRDAGSTSMGYTGW